MRRTSRSSAIRAIRFTASTCGAARVTSASSATASCWRRARARSCSSRRACPRASTCRARTWCSTCNPAPGRRYCPYKGQASYWSRRGGRASAPRPGLELRGPAAGRHAGDRPRRLLRRARRRRARRRAAGAAAHRGVEGDHGRGRASPANRIVAVAPGDVQSAFAQAAAEDGIVLGSQRFDWLCEQGHVGLERVAKARRDPALVGPVKAALAPLAAIYARLKGDVSVLHASRENLLLAVDLVHAPTGTVIEVDEAAHFSSFRLTALELYPADVRVGFDLGEHRELCRAWCARTDRPGPRAGGQGLRLRRAPARARLSRRAARSRRAGHGPPAGGPDRRRGRRRGGRLRAPPRGAAGPQRRLRLGSCSSVAETLIVEQRPHLTRTL